VLENDIDGGVTATPDFKQNGTSESNYKYNHVLRASSVEGNAYGELLIDGAVTNGQIIDKNYTINLNPSWTKRLYPVAILWKYDDASTAPKYKFINCFEKK
jgi:hypothetical protein